MQRVVTDLVLDPVARNAGGEHVGDRLEEGAVVSLIEPSAAVCTTSTPNGRSRSPIGTLAEARIPAVVTAGSGLNRSSLQTAPEIIGRSA